MRREALRGFGYERVADTSPGDYKYRFADGLGNRYTVHVLPVEGRPGCYELEYLTQELDYTEMTAGFIPFSISNTVFGDILEDFAGDPGFDEVVIRPTDDRRMRLYLRTLRQRFAAPEWRVEVDGAGDITVRRAEPDQTTDRPVA